VHPSLQLYGLDYSGPLVEVARRRVARKAPGHFWCGDIRDVDFLPAEEFNYAVSFRVFFCSWVPQILN
jgi:hypothetical protein